MTKLHEQFIFIGILLLALLVAGCSAPQTGSSIAPRGDVQTIRMTVEGIDYVPAEFQVEVNRPVRFIVDGTNAEGCVKYFSIPSLKINEKLKPGENIYEFTPQKTGKIPFSCSMGMVFGSINVVEALSEDVPPKTQSFVQSTFLPGQSTNNDNILPVQASQVVTLEDGDTFTLRADFVRSGNEIKYGYNGMIPGPTLKVKQGSTITVDFTNAIDMNTTIHWHGLRHDIRDDGVPGVSQDPIPPGGSYRYTLQFPDAGIFWYHPHIREDIQQDSGLAAAIMVVPHAQYQNTVNHEELLILDDSLLENGATVPYGKDHAHRALMGRYGNVLTVNGQENYVLDIRQGDVVRFHLTNVANVRPFNISIPGATIKMIASDLSNYERDQFVQNVIIAPAERYTIEVLFENPGHYPIKNINPFMTYTLGTIRVDAEISDENHTASFKNLRENTDVIRDIDRFRQYFSKEPEYTLVLTVDVAGAMQGMGHGMMHIQDNIEWEDTMPMMNARFGSDKVRWILQDQRTKKENMNLAMQATVGDVVKIRLVNTKESPHPMQHPIHLHGQRFLVLTDNGIPHQNLVWKDTVLVPVGHTVDILVDVTNPGEWMMHCHIAEHLEAGMMTSFIVASDTSVTSRSMH